MKKILIISITVLPLFAAFSCNDQINDIYQQQELSKGIVAYWPITGSSYKMQKDYSGNGFDLVLQSGIASNIAPGKFSTALSFNNCSMLGSCDPVGDTAAFPESVAVSVSIWVLFNSSGGTQIERLVATDRFSLSMISDQIFFAGPDWNSQSPYFKVTPGKWYHIVGIYNRKTVRLYVNGELYGSSDSLVSDPVPKSTFYWVKSVAGGWSGMLDEIRIYNRELSDDEIQELVTVGKD